MKNLLLPIGVFQGTIIRPLLFIMCINDLLTTVPENCIMSYINKTVVIDTGKTSKQSEQEMKYWNEVELWIAFNELSLNVTKTVHCVWNLLYSFTSNLNITINIK